MEWIDILGMLPTAFGFYLGYWLEKRTEAILNDYDSSQSKQDFEK